MININKFRETYNFLLKANTRGRNTAKEFNEAVNYASRKIYMDFYGNQQMYAPNRAVSRISYEESQRISDALKPFKSEPTPISVSLNKFQTPKDNQHVISVRYNGIDVKRFDEDEIGTVLNSSIVAPTKEYPAYVEYPAYLKVYPSTISTISVVYLKKPTDAKWAYTLDANGREVYDSVNSVDLQWNEDMYNQLMAVTLEMTGLTLKDSDLTQFFAAKENQGQ